MEKANEYAVESLKQIITLASAILALTTTFLKDVLGDGRQQATCKWLVPVGWILLLVSIPSSWSAIVKAADEIGSNADAGKTYVFKSNKGTPKHVFYTLFSWFLPSIPATEQNSLRKLAASAQNYFLLGLFSLGLFAGLNLSVRGS